MSDSDIQDQLDKYLTDAHSIEEQALQQLRTAPEIAGDPQLSKIFADHLEPGCRLERHRDSAEETIVVLDGEAQVSVGEEGARLPAGGLALIPADAAHEVRNAGPVMLRFVAVYASADVVTRYERDVGPDGSRERDPLG